MVDARPGCAASPAGVSFATAVAAVGQPVVPAASFPGLPYRGVAQYLLTPGPGPEGRESWCHALRRELARYPHGTCRFETVDISGTRWDAESFGLLLAILQESSATVHRAKFFKCGLGDDAIKLLAVWLQRVPPDLLPDEIHLSHNEITVESFNPLVYMVAANVALKPRRLPIWLRIEGNAIEVPVLQALVTQGRACFAEEGQCGIKHCAMHQRGGSPFLHLRYGQNQNLRSSSAPAPLASMLVPRLVAPPQKQVSAIDAPAVQAGTTGEEKLLRPSLKKAGAAAPPQTLRPGEGSEQKGLGASRPPTPCAPSTASQEDGAGSKPAEGAKHATEPPKEKDKTAEIEAQLAIIRQKKKELGLLVEDLGIATPPEKRAAAKAAASGHLEQSREKRRPSPKRGARQRPQRSPARKEGRRSSDSHRKTDQKRKQEQKRKPDKQRGRSSSSSRRRRSSRSSSSSSSSSVKRRRRGSSSMRKEAGRASAPRNASAAGSACKVSLESWADDDERREELSGLNARVQQLFAGIC